MENYGRNWETPEGVDWKSLQADLELLRETFASSDAVPEELHLGPQQATVIEKGQASGLLRRFKADSVACRRVGSWTMLLWCWS